MEEQNSVNKGRDSPAKVEWCERKNASRVFTVNSCMIFQYLSYRQNHRVEFLRLQQCSAAASIPLLCFHCCILGIPGGSRSEVVNAFVFVSLGPAVAAQPCWGCLCSLQEAPSDSRGRKRDLGCRGSSWERPIVLYGIPRVYVH